MLAELTERFGEPARAKVLAGEVVDADGVVVDEARVLPAGAHVYLYRDLPDEVAVPFEIPVLYRDDDIVVVDKPHFLATMPRGRHVAQTALVRLRRELGLPELSPAHRLDRLTAGVLLFTARREVRGTFQTLFARGEVSKTYLARAAVDPALRLPRVVRSRIVKHRGRLQAVSEPGEPNAETLIELIARKDGLYRLTPRTGRTIGCACRWPRWGCRSPGTRCTPTSSTSHRTTSARRCGCWRSASSSTTRAPVPATNSSAGALWSPRTEDRGH